MKKQSFITILLTVFMSMARATAFAYDIAVANSDGITIYYNWVNEEKTELAVCKGNREYGGNVVIPASVEYQGIKYNVTKIAMSAFYDNWGLTSVTIPYSVRRIENEAFNECFNLKSITIPIPNNLTYIDDFAFGERPTHFYLNVIVNDLQDFFHQNYLGNRLGSYKNLFDKDGKEIKEIIIPNDVTSISDYAFIGCRGLTSITIPNSVTSIGARAFDGCSGLTTIAIPNSVTSIGAMAFSGCSGLTSLNIPNNVTSIGDHVFSGCSGLTSLNIPNNVTSIGDHVFSGCSGLTSINLPNSLKTIGSEAFSNCSGLTSITVPNSVTSIGSGAFKSCPSLSSIQVETGNNNYDSRNNCNAIIDNNNQLIAGCKNTIIPNSVTSIGARAFDGCSGLTSITIPNSVTSIGNFAFRYCSGLTSMSISQNVTSIGYGAFEDCTGLFYIILPSNLTSIDNYCFHGCINLSYIYCNAKKVPSAGNNAFGYNKNITFFVPYESIEAYKNTSPWSNYTDYNIFNNNSPGIEKCSKPTISFSDGKFVFKCDTPDVAFYWAFSFTSGIKGSSYQVSPASLSVFASKFGYQNSDVTTYMISGLTGDVNGDNKVDVADHVELSKIILNQQGSE